jgi:hypothetical protein
LLAQVKIKVKKISAYGRLIGKMLINSLVFYWFSGWKVFSADFNLSRPEGVRKVIVLVVGLKPG